MLFSFFLLPLSSIMALGAIIPRSNSTSLNNYPLPVHNITRFSEDHFENLAVRPNGQILTTTAGPKPNVYNVDPLGILPPVVVHTIADTKSAVGIAEGKPDVYYVASMNTNMKVPPQSFPGSYHITEIDMRGVSAQLDGTLSRQPGIRTVASLDDALLLNGVAFARPESENLLVADSFQGLIWNVNVVNGHVGVTLNDTATKGVLNATDGKYTGINGIKVHDGTIYWTVTGTDELWKIPVDEEGNVYPETEPTLVAKLEGCDDLVLDRDGNAYVASPLGIITKVSPSGEKLVIAGSTGNDTSLHGPSALRFGRLASDEGSIYVTTNGGLPPITVAVPGSQGIRGSIGRQSSEV